MASSLSPAIDTLQGYLAHTKHPPRTLQGYLAHTKHPPRTLQGYLAHKKHPPRTLQGYLAHEKQPPSGVELIVASSLSRAIDTADIIFPPGEVRRARVCLCVRVSGCQGVWV